MPSELEETCEVCNKRLATRHSIHSNTGQVIAMCSTCFDQCTTPDQVEALRAVAQPLKDAKCDYCGAPAVRSTAYLGHGDDTKQQFLCMRCLQDLADFNTRPENAILDFDVEDEVELEQASRLLANRNRRREQFMRERVMARGRVGK